MIKYSFSLFALVALSPLAAALSSDSPHYNANAYLHQFVANAPQADREIFYYNDFNQYSRFWDGNTTYVNRGTAVIGAERGSFLGFRTGTGAQSTVPALSYQYDAGVSPNPHDPSVLAYGESGSSADYYTSGLGYLQANATYRNTVSAQGVRFSISTVGYESIFLSFDFAVLLEFSSANYLFRASADGGSTWFFSEDITGLSTEQWYDDFIYDFSDYSTANDNPSLVFEMLAVPDSEGVWVDMQGNTMSSTSRNRFGLDRITLSGDALSLIPEPAASAVLLGLAATFAAALRRPRRL